MFTRQRRVYSPAEALSRAFQRKETHLTESFDLECNEALQKQFRADVRPSHAFFPYYNPDMELDEMPPPAAGSRATLTGALKLEGMGDIVVKTKDFLDYAGLLKYIGNFNVGGGGMVPRMINQRIIGGDHEGDPISGNPTKKDATVDTTHVSYPPRQQVLEFELPSSALRLPGTGFNLPAFRKSLQSAFSRGIDEDVFLGNPTAAGYQKGLRNEPGVKIISGGAAAPWTTTGSNLTIARLRELFDAVCGDNGMPNWVVSSYRLLSLAKAIAAIAGVKAFIEPGTQKREMMGITAETDLGIPWIATPTLKSYTSASGNNVVYDLFIGNFENYFVNLYGSGASLYLDFTKEPGKTIIVGDHFYGIGTPDVREFGYVRGIRQINP